MLAPISSASVCAPTQASLKRQPSRSSVRSHSSALRLKIFIQYDLLSLGAPVGHGHRESRSKNSKPPRSRRQLIHQPASPSRATLAHPASLTLGGHSGALAQTSPPVTRQAAERARSGPR